MTYLPAIKPCLLVASLLTLCGALLAQSGVSNPEKARELFIAGTSLQMQGDRHAEAILEFQESLRYDSSAVTMQAIAKSYLELRKLDRALEFAAMAVSVDSLSADGWELFAEVLVSNGRYDEGVKAFEKVRGLNPTVRQLYTLGKLYEPRNAKKAIAVFEEVADREPDVGIFRQLAEMYKRTRDLPGQLSALKRAYTFDPDSPVSLSEYVVGLLDNGDMDTALVLTKQWINQSYDEESKARVWITVLNKLYSDSLLSFVYKDSTLACVDYSAQMFKQHWQITSLAGTLALMLHDVQRSDRMFLLAIQTNPTDPELRISIAGFNIENGNYEFSRKLLLQSVPLFPRNPRLFILLGWCQQLLLNHELALENYTHAIGIDSNLFEAWVRIGNVYDSFGNHRAADSAFEQALRIEPDDALVCNNYAYSLSVQGKNLELARILSWKSLQQFPTNASYLDTYGWILFKLGDIDGAEKFIQRAIQYDGNATHYDHLGDVLEKQGELDGAVKAWERALQLDGSKNEIQFKIDRYR